VAPRRTQSERREETVGALLRAAAGLFLERGVALTSLEEISARAGVSKGALYHHFASKDELVAGVIAALATFDPAADASHGDAVARASASRTGPLLERALNYELYALAARSPAIRDALGARVRAAIDELAEAHHTSASQVVVAAALHEGLWVHRLLNPDLVTDEVFADAFAALEHLGSAQPSGR
jgi:AcrR family transcriptional regulator